MNKFVRITNCLTQDEYAVAVLGDGWVKAFPVSTASTEWADWASSHCKSLDDINDSLSYDLQHELPQVINEVSSISIKSLLSDEDFYSFTGLASESQVELVDAVNGHGRRYVVKNLASIDVSESPTSLPLKAYTPSFRQTVINYKAMSFRSENTFSEVAFEVKRSRALWDPDLGPSGGWRCPPGTQYGGFITDRFGRGCGGGALRRVGRALVNAGRGIDKLGARRDARRLNRAAERAQRGETRRERVGAAVRRGVGNVSNALERGAQRLVGEYQPRDYDPRTGRMRRRGVDAPEISRERRNAINSRLVEIRDELDDLADKPRNPANARRERQLVEENRRLRRERDGASPQRVSRVAPARERRRVIAPAAGERGRRQQGERPTRKPVAERGRRNWRERAAERLVGEFEPREYKPGDKKRIKNRENRYAKVSDAQLRRALANYSPKRAKPGETKEREARRRQERLEILQEMVNRGLPIPEQYKREVRQYRLKPQRRRRGDGLNRQGRAAVALERAAQRVRQENENVSAPRRRANPQEMQKRRIERARKNRPDGVSEEDWNKYQEYLDDIPEGNFNPPDGAPQLEPVLSFNSWKRRVLPNEDRRRDVGPSTSRLRKGQLDDLSDEEIIDKLRAYRRIDGTSPFDMESLTDDELNRLDKIVSDENNFGDIRRNGVFDRHPATVLVWGEVNRRQDGGSIRRRGADGSMRDRIRSARTARTTESSLRRPQPKRFQGDAFDMDTLDRDQKIRMRNLLKDEKALLDAEWRKRLGLNPSDEITDKAIRDYIRDRENNKPGAYIGVLKAKANDWKVLNDWQKKVDDRPAGANITGENDALNRIGPKRRNGVIRNFNDNVPAISRSGRQRPERRRETPRLIERQPEREVDRERVSSLIQQSIQESIGGSMPDERSRRNVRNRFPNNGLPERAFWRDSDWVGRGPDDREKHEKRFGRYYGSDGRINARGRLVNDMLQKERDDLKKLEASLSKRSRDVAKEGLSASAPKDKTPIPKAPNLIVREGEFFKKRDGELKADESRLRAKYRDVFDSGDIDELFDMAKKYQDDATSADETVVYMLNNGMFEGANGEILAENMAFFDHAERMQDFLVDLIQQRDSRRAQRLRERAGKRTLSESAVSQRRSRSRNATDLRQQRIENLIKQAREIRPSNSSGLQVEINRWNDLYQIMLDDIDVELQAGRFDAADGLVDRMTDSLERGLAQYNETDFPGPAIPGKFRAQANAIEQANARIAQARAVNANAPSGRRRGSAATPSPTQAPGTPARAIKELVPDTPRKRDPKVPNVGEDGTVDDPVPVGKVIVNPEITNAVSAAKWLDDGKPLSEVPQIYWWDALRMHTEGNSKKQFVPIGKNGGIMGDVRIYLAVDDDENTVGQGILLKADLNAPRNNVNEVAGYLMVHAAGTEIDIAGFDGDVGTGIPASIVPFAWNRAPEGEVLMPKDIGLEINGWAGNYANFDKRQFNELPDKAYPQRLSALLNNYVLAVGDRHDQNQMGAMIDGKPFIVPIDLGFMGQLETDDIAFYERSFGADSNLFDSIKSHLASLDDNSRAEQLAALTNVLDGIIERLAKIENNGRANWVDRVMASVDTSAIPANRLRAMQDQADTTYDIIAVGFENLRQQRDDILALITP